MLFMSSVTVYYNERRIGTHKSTQMQARTKNPRIISNLGTYARLYYRCIEPT